MKEIKWYNFFSIWIFIWFLLYKFNLVKYEPSFNYIFAIIFTLIEILYFMIFIFKKNKIDYGALFIKSLFGIIFDIIPFISLLPLTLNYETFVVNVLVFGIYILLEYLLYNRDIVDVLNIYLNRLYVIQSISLKKYLNELAYIFNFKT